MDCLNPIHTESTTCQDCYKCLRECAVKAILIEKSCARILPEECTLCGHCVAVCPVGAKKVRDDTGRFQALRQGPSQGRHPLVALVAPSWVSEYPGLELEQLAAALGRLGFAQVLEVSQGALLANQACAGIIRSAPAGRKLFISSACPTIVRYLRLYQPHLARWLLEVESPLELTARLAHERFGSQAACVFFGPCIAKKSESDRNRRLIDLALTWRDLDTLLGPDWDSALAAGTPASQEAGNRFADNSPLATAPAGCPGEAAAASGPGSPAPSGSGDTRGPHHKAHLYPIDGGMTTGLKQLLARGEVDTMVFSGMVHVRQALEGMAPEGLDTPLFLELMACEGGCVNGPQARLNRGTILKRLDVIREQSRRLDPLPPAQPAPPAPSAPSAGGPAPGPAPGPAAAAPALPPDGAGPGEAVRYYCPAADPLLADSTAAAGPTSPGRPDPNLPGSAARSFTADEIRQSLARIGKHQPKDELNCSACGYDSCRDFARACLQGKAESTMCVSWMRNLVEKKANALLATMPSGVVILDSRLRVVESNRNFARMMGPETAELFDLHPGLAGADASLILPRPDLFRLVLEQPGTSLEEDLNCNGRILHCHIFGIEPGQVAGGLFQDITTPTVQRDRVVQQAQEVIEKHLGVVQQIAWLLGENAAESEAILNSIIQSFSPPGTQAAPGGQA